MPGKTDTTEEYDMAMSVEELTKLTEQATFIEKMPERGRPKQPNPFEDLVRKAFDSKQPASLPPVKSEETTRISSLLRRAAEDIGCGIRIRLTSGPKGKGTVVNFETTPERQKRTVRYTSEDIRNWYRDTTGNILGSGPIPQDIREQYRAQHGFK